MENIIYHRDIEGWHGSIRRILYITSSYSIVTSSCFRIGRALVKNKSPVFSSKSSVKLIPFWCHSMCIYISETYTLLMPLHVLHQWNLYPLDATPCITSVKLIPSWCHSMYYISETYTLLMPLHVLHQWNLYPLDATPCITSVKLIPWCHSMYYISETYTLMPLHVLHQYVFFLLL